MLEYILQNDQEIYTIANKNGLETNPRSYKFCTVIRYLEMILKKAAFQKNKYSFIVQFGD